jgi:isochorismate hydrolase
LRATWWPGADTLVVTGCTTSGCAALSSTASPTISGSWFHDCVYDRSAVSHAVNLFDMSEKYADVMSTREAIERLNGLSQSETAGTQLRA